MEPATLTPHAANTRQRLLDAAARVYARNGLEGATTREIAREAGVNEVTLFRHFQSKEKLLGAVVQRTLDQQDATLAAQQQRRPPAAAPSGSRPPAGRTGRARRAGADDTLRADLLLLARRYEELLNTNMPLVRTLIGEIHRHSEHEVRVMKSIFLPFKAELLATVQAAARAGRLRPGVDVTIATDLFSSMIFTSALRRCGPVVPEYTAAQYHAACVDVFLRGIER